MHPTGAVPPEPARDAPDPSICARVFDRWRSHDNLTRHPKITPGMERAIKAELKNITDPRQGVVVVERYIDSLKPKPNVDPLVLLRGLEAGVKALQIAKGKQ